MRCTFRSRRKGGEKKELGNELHGTVLNEPRRPYRQRARDERRHPALDLSGAAAVPHLQDEEHDR